MSERRDDLFQSDSGPKHTALNYKRSREVRGTIRPLLHEDSKLW